MSRGREEGHLAAPSVKPACMWVLAGALQGVSLLRLLRVSVLPAFLSGARCGQRLHPQEVNEGSRLLCLSSGVCFSSPCRATNCHLWLLAAVPGCPFRLSSAVDSLPWTSKPDSSRAC